MGKQIKIGPDTIGGPIFNLGDGGTGIFSGQANTLPDPNLHNQDDLYYDNGVGVFRLVDTPTGASTSTIIEATLAAYLASDSSSSTSDATINITNSPSNFRSGEFRVRNSGNGLLGAGTAWTNVSRFIVFDTSSGFDVRPLTDLATNNQFLVFGDADNWAFFTKTGTVNSFEAEVTLGANNGVLLGTIRPYFDTATIDVLTSLNVVLEINKEWVNDVQTRVESTALLSGNEIMGTRAFNDVLTSVDGTNLAWAHRGDAIDGGAVVELRADGAVTQGAYNAVRNGTTYSLGEGPDTPDDFLTVVINDTTSNVTLNVFGPGSFTMRPSVGYVWKWNGSTWQLTWDFWTPEGGLDMKNGGITFPNRTLQTTAAFGFTTEAQALFSRVDSFGTFQTPALLPTPVTGYDSTTHLVLDGVAYYIHYLKTGSSTAATLTTVADTDTIIFTYNIN